MDLEKLSVEEIQELMKQPFKCDFIDCCSYGEYNECYNHSHVLCKNYEVYYEATKNKLRKI